MKAMVCLKQVPHQDARLDVAADGAWIQEDLALYSDTARACGA